MIKLIISGAITVYIYNYIPTSTAVCTLYTVPPVRADTDSDMKINK